jgi:hypothetical protein
VDAETQEALQREHEATASLATKLSELEGQLVKGGEHASTTSTTNNKK